MNRADISKTLDNLHPKINQIDDKVEKATVSEILNLVETLVARIDELENENQSLKNEINRLKGEQGKPDIKANKKQDGDISSENERREAEETDEERAKKTGFKLDKSSLKKLKEQRLPVQLLEKLEALQDHKYSNEIDFINEIEATIGSELTDENRDLLLQYARYKKRNRQAKIPKITIDRREDCPVDRSQLPEDAVLKDHEYKVVQDVTIKTYISRIAECIF